MNNRRSIRKPGHDYAAPGDYYVTLCTRLRQSLLGEIRDDAMVPSAMGDIVQAEWQRLAERFPTIRLDAFAVMPNHVHGIITIVGVALAAARAMARSGDAALAVARGADPAGGDDGGNPVATPSGPAVGRAAARAAPTLGAIVGAFKSLSDRRCRQVFAMAHPGRRFGHLWQRNYHDHIVADAGELDRIRRYIRVNVDRWTTDGDDPARPT